MLGSDRNIAILESKFMQACEMVKEIVGSASDTVLMDGNRDTAPPADGDGGDGGL